MEWYYDDRGLYKKCGEDVYRLVYRPNQVKGDLTIWARYDILVDDLPSGSYVLDRGSSGQRRLESVLKLADEDIGYQRERHKAT